MKMSFQEIILSAWEIENQIKNMILSIYVTVHTVFTAIVRCELHSYIGSIFIGREVRRRKELGSFIASRC